MAVGRPPGRTKETEKDLVWLALSDKRGETVMTGLAESGVAVVETRTAMGRLPLKARFRRWRRCRRWRWRGWCRLRS